MDGWREIQKDLYQEVGKKERHPPAFLRHMGSRLYAETGCRKAYDGKVFEWHIHSTEAKETSGGGCGRNYANSQSANQNRPNAIIRVSAVQDSAKNWRWEHWWSGGWNILSHQQCRLWRNGNDSYGSPPLHSISRHLYDGIMMHKS